MWDDFSGLTDATSAPSDLVRSFDVDFVLTVGGPELPDGMGGVPFGDAEAAGYTGLSDFLRGGGDGESYIASVNSGSLSDILRSGGESPGFDPNTYGSGGAQPGGVVTEWNVSSVIDSVTKGVAALGGIALGALALTKGGGSANPGASSGSGTTANPMPFWQRMGFPTSPGPSGNLPNMLMWGSLAAVGALLIYMIVAKR